MRLGPIEIIDSRAQARERSQLSMQEYFRQVDWWMKYGAHVYPIGLNQTMPGQAQEAIPNNFVGYVQAAYKTNGIVFACLLARRSLFSQGRFQYRRLRNGKPGDLWGDEKLAKLERPWPGAKTSALLARMEDDDSLAGGCFIYDRGSRGLRRLRPDWTTIAITSEFEDPRLAHADPDAEVAGYIYTPGGPGSGAEPIALRPELVAHYYTTDDPEATFRGMSWITSVAVEIMGDKAASAHKLDFFERGGTPNMTVEYDPEVVTNEDEFVAWMEAIEGQISNWSTGNRRLHLGGGTKANVVGSNFQEVEFKATQGAGETRIAAAAGVPAVVLGISEGLQGSSLNTGNYAAAMRRFSDITLERMWGAAADALDKLIRVPNDSELVVDKRFIPALQADRTAAAEIQNKEAETIVALGNAGWKLESVKTAVMNSDWALLEEDPDFKSVQVAPATPPASPNGNETKQKREAAVASATEEE